MTHFMARASYALINIVVCIIYLSIYGYLRAYISIKLGDKGEQAKERLSLNPSLHMDSIGLLFMIFYNVGFIKPMANQTVNFKNRKSATMLIAILPTFILFTLSTIVMLVYFYVVEPMQMPNGAYIVVFNEQVLPAYISNTIIQSIRLSLGMLLYNIIPIYPLEGEKIFNYIVSPNLRFAWLRYDKALQMFLVLLTIMGVIPNIIESICIEYIGLFF